MFRWRESIEDIVMIYVLVLAVLMVIGGLLLSIATYFCSLISTLAGGVIIWAALKRSIWLKPPPDQKFAQYYPYTRYFPYLPPDKIQRFRAYVKRFSRKLNIPPVKILLAVFLISILVGSLVLLTIETQFGIFAWIPFIFVFIIAFSFPSLMWISLVYNEDTFTPEPARNIMIVLTWGMLSVIPALIGNTAMGVFFLAAGFSAAVVSFMVATFSAPFVEELMKPLGLGLVKLDINTRLDGLIYGVTAGMGFAMIENLSYEVGTLIVPFFEVNMDLGAMENVSTTSSSAFAFITLARGLGSTIIHAVGAGMIGMAYFKYRNSPHRPILSLIGAYAFAVIVHMSWNGILSTIELYELPEYLSVIFMICFPLLMLFVLIQMIRSCKREEPEVLEPRLAEKKGPGFELPDIPVPPQYPYYQYPYYSYPQYPYYGPPPSYYPQHPYPPPPPPAPPPQRPPTTTRLPERNVTPVTDNKKEAPAAKGAEGRMVRCPRCDKISRIPPLIYGNDMICPHCGMLFRHPY